MLVSDFVFTLFPMDGKTKKAAAFHFYEQHNMITPKVASWSFKASSGNILFFAGGLWSHSKVVQRNRLSAGMCRICLLSLSPCVWACTHRYTLPVSSRLDRMLQSESLSHCQVVRRYFVPCSGGLTAPLRSPDRNHKSLQRVSDAVRTTALYSQLLLYTPQHSRDEIKEDSLLLTMLSLIRENSFRYSNHI